MTTRTSFFAWPGLAPLRGQVPRDVEYERGIWGKAHGQNTDYRWLARSPRFFGHDHGVERELVVGPEDEPRDSTYWRSLPYGYYAIKLSRSRARDAAGRGGFSEKQVLEWRRSASVPPALGALALLPLVATLDDEVWWSQRDNKLWLSASYCLGLDPEHHEPVTLDVEQLRESIARGCERLREVGEEQIAALYTAILDGRTGWLIRRPEPLPPESLAVLLLPLPPDTGVQVSLASWIPSSRADALKLGEWKVIVNPVGVTVRGGPTATESPSELAREMAYALLEGDPRRLEGFPALWPSPVEGEEVPAELAGISEKELDFRLEARFPAASRRHQPSPSQEVPLTPELALGEEIDIDKDLFQDVVESAKQVDDRTFQKRRPGSAEVWEPSEEALMRPRLQLPITKISDDAPPVVQELYDFARNADRRWLEPRSLKGNGSCQPLRPQDQDALALKRWIAEVSGWRPRYSKTFQGPLAEADPNQWGVKADLLRSAALVLVPHPSTVDDVGELESDLVPPLFFLEVLKEDARDQLMALGAENLRQLIARSRSCRHSFLRARVTNHLITWRTGTKNKEIRELLASQVSGALEG